MFPPGVQKAITIRTVIETSSFSGTTKNIPHSQCQIAMSEDWRGGDVCRNNDCICYICTQKVTTDIDKQNDKEDKKLTKFF